MRADVYLTVRGYAPSRQQAKRLIEEGNARIGGIPIHKASDDIPDGTEIEIRDLLRYVGRGGLKLEAALEAFGMDVTGADALDIGASTGGFTDCLLAHGAATVCAVDAGEGQLAAKLRNDPRVRAIEHCNARYLTAETVGAPVSLIVMDVSFISATYIIPRFPALLQPSGEAVCLIKPQFEVGRAMIGKGGIVRSVEAQKCAVERVLAAGRAAGLRPVGLIASPITGGDGNREFLVRFTREGGLPEVDESAVSTVIENRKGAR